MRRPCIFQSDTADPPLSAAASAVVDPASKLTHVSIKSFPPHLLLKRYQSVLD